MKKSVKTLPFPEVERNNALYYYVSGEEHKYKAVINNSSQGFLLTVNNENIVENNPAASAMFGYSTLEFKLLNYSDLIDHQEPVFKSALTQLHKKGSTITEATGIKKDGERFPVEITAALFSDTNGKRKYSNMIIDMTRQKKTEATLALSNDRINMIVKATKEIIWDWDLGTGDIYRNGNSLLDFLGPDSNDLAKTNKIWADHIHPLDKDRIKSQIDHYIHSSFETDFNLEYRFRKNDGSIVYISDKGYIIRNEQGKAIRMIGAAEDITERKKTAQAIEESELRYKIFIQQSTEGIWRIELTEPMYIYTPVEQMITYCLENAHIAECNDTFAKMYGYENADQMIGCPLHKILPLENPLNIGYFQKFFSNGFKVVEELSYENDREGNRMILLNNMVGIIEGDYIKRAWGTQRNITNQKKAENDLVESENHLKAIVNADPECIKLISREGIILQMNPAGLQMIGAYHADQVLGKNALQLIAPAYHDAFAKSLAEVFEGKTSKLVFEIIGLHKRQLFMESHSVPLKNAAGEIISALSVTRDITENKNAEAKLLASEKRYRHLFNNNPASVIIWDIDTLDILEVNESAVELYGYPRNEFLKLSIMDLRSAAYRPEFLSFIEKVKHKDVKKEHFTWQHVTKNELPLTMEITSHKIKYLGKNAVLALGINITEKIQLENSLSEERELRQLQVTQAVIAGQEQERSELGQELHDNINQILASTKLYIECAIKDPKPRPDLMAESKILVEKAMVEIRCLSKSLLPPSLGETGLLQSLHELIENITQVNNLAITVDWDIKNENETCNNLKLTIYRIVQEQLNNIIKHAEAKNVVIQVRETDSQILMSVKDDGLGFNTTLKRNGVGLRNISSRAQVNKGCVSIISSPGEGCELTVKFPLSTDSQKTIINI